MFKKFASLFSLIMLVIVVFGSASGSVSAAKPTPPPPTPTSGAPTPIQVYGAWHCSNDSCLWATVRTVSEFDSMNHWLIDRGDGRPSVNVVVLSFVNPLKLLNKTNDAGTVNGVPKGMTSDIVNYFKSKGIRVMLSIGGITFVNDWNTALATNATQFGLNAAEVARNLGVGIEIDYEENNSPNLTGLQAFITAFRSQNPYDATGATHSARLTIDLGAGNRWLVPSIKRPAQIGSVRPIRSSTMPMPWWLPGQTPIPRRSLDVGVNISVAIYKRCRWLQPSSQAVFGCNTGLHSRNV